MREDDRGQRPLRRTGRQGQIARDLGAVARLEHDRLHRRHGLSRELGIDQGNLGEPVGLPVESEDRARIPIAGDDDEVITPVPTLIDDIDLRTRKELRDVLMDLGDVAIEEFPVELVGVIADRRETPVFAECQQAGDVEVRVRKDDMRLLACGQVLLEKRELAVAPVDIEQLVRAVPESDRLKLVLQIGLRLFVQYAPVGILGVAYIPFPLTVLDGLIEPRIAASVGDPAISLVT